MILLTLWYKKKTKQKTMKHFPSRASKPKKIKSTTNQKRKKGAKTSKGNRDMVGKGKQMEIN